MKINFFQCLLFISILAFVSYSQNEPTDLKLKGMKGDVRSVISASKPISGYAEWVLKDKTKYQTTDTYDRNGNLTESLSEGQSTTKYLYSKVDGNKSFKMIELKPNKSALRFTSEDREEPIEANEKLTEPDLRFDFKYTYKAADNGRIVTERQFGNDGKLFRKRIYEFNKQGMIIRRAEDDTVAKMEFIYKYDDAGVLIQTDETRDIKGAGTDSKSITLFTDYKFDNKGNWTERKATVKSRTDAQPKYNIPEKEYILVSVETRTITYH